MPCVKARQTSGALAERSITGIFIVQGEKFVYINPVFTEATGYTLKDLSSMNFWDIISPGVREVVKAKAAARQQTGDTAPAKYEMKVITKSGEEKFAHVDVTFIEFKEKPAILGSVTDLTERKLMEDALRESEAKYRTIFENTIEGMFQMTPDGRILSANPAMARIHGYDTPEELIRNVDDLAKIYVDPDCHSYFRMLLGEENEVKNFECAAYRKDGRKRWISLTARAVRGSKGTILHYEGTAQDITERRDAEEKLRESEEKFRLLFDKSADAIVLLDGETYVDCNEAAVRVLKCSKEQVIGKNPLDFSPERQPDGRLSADKIPENIHTLGRGVIGSNGSRGVLTAKGAGWMFRSPLSRCGAGAPYSVWRNISARKRAEEALKEREKELERKSVNLEEANAALKMLLKLREEQERA